MQFEYCKNILSVSNYRQIQQLDSDLIALEYLTIHGQKLEVLRLDKDSIVIKGIITQIEIGDAKK